MNVGKHALPRTRAKIYENVCMHLYAQNYTHLLTGKYDIMSGCMSQRSKYRQMCIYIVAHVHVYAGHRGEISSCQFDWEGMKCISGSIDRTCKIWDVKSGQCIHTLRGHNDEILDGGES